jgi:hypothetical protein
LRLEIKNASGTWKDFSALGGKDYVLGAASRTDVDSPVWSMQARFKRDGEAATESLAPLRGDSTLNVNDASTYAPAINAAREWRLSVAVVAAGATVLSGDWKELCAGYLDKPDFTSRRDDRRRPLGGRAAHGPDHPRQAHVHRHAGRRRAADRHRQHPTPAPTLYIPTPPAFTVTDYTPYQVSVMDALVTLALSTGWMVRDVYDPADSTMKTGIIDPNRDKASADATIAPTVYLTVDGASLDMANVRNYIEGEAIDSETGGVITTFARDPASIAAFGGVERYMKFSEDATSPIDTFDELQAMVDAALADLSVRRSSTTPLPARSFGPPRSRTSTTSRATRSTTTPRSGWRCSGSSTTSARATRRRSSSVAARPRARSSNGYAARARGRRRPPSPRRRSSTSC